MAFRRAGFFALCRRAAPCASSTPSPTPGSVLFSIAGAFASQTLTIGVRLTSTAALVHPIDLFAIAEVFGAYYILPGFTEGILPLAEDIAISQALDTGWLVLLDVSGLELGGQVVPINLYSAAIDSVSLNVLGPLGSDSVEMR